MQDWDLFRIFVAEKSRQKASIDTREKSSSLSKKGSMKKILNLIGSLAIGAIFGLALAFLLIWSIDGSEGISDVVHKDLNMTKIAISIACPGSGLRTYR